MNPDTVFFIIYNLLTMYYYALILYIIFSWVQSLRESAFYGLLGIICEPFFKIFRGWLRFGMMDFTPAVGLIMYQLALQFVATNYG